MSLSTRVSVAFPPEIPPSEDTDTLVFTFPSSSSTYTIDLRFIDSGEKKGSQDWGYAGTIVTEGKKTTFIHEVDSNDPHDPLSVTDAGYFEELPNGDEIEKGEMFHPGRNKIMQYEEIWRKLAFSGPSGSVCLESLDDGTGKAFIGRIGEWFQGIGVTNGQVTAVRYRYDGEKWVKAYSLGSDESGIPLIGVDDSMMWHEGEEVDFGGRKWIVRYCTT